VEQPLGCGPTQALYRIIISYDIILFKSYAGMNMKTGVVLSEVQMSAVLGTGRMTCTKKEQE
jgi:hypothetical protein